MKLLWTIDFALNCDSSSDLSPILGLESKKCVKIFLIASETRIGFNFSFNSNLFVYKNQQIHMHSGVFIARNFHLLVKRTSCLMKPYFYLSDSSFSKLYMIGLGFKNFVFRDELHILVGDCNYILLKIPDEIKIFCRKGRIYMLSNSAEKLYNFSAILKRIKKPNFYKGKGILEFKNFKFMKLKIGKKQRFA